MKGILFKLEVWQAKLRVLEQYGEAQTRRAEAGLKIVNQAPDVWRIGSSHILGSFQHKSGLCTLVKPRYQVGETVYVKEAWSDIYCWAKEKAHVLYALEYPPAPRGFKWKSPFFMPEWAARYFITITDVRAERLGNMISGDCLAEGITASDEDGIGQQGIKLDYKFRQLWNSINAKWKRVYNTELKIYEFWQFPWCEEDAKPIPKTTQHPKRYHCVPNPWVFAYTFKQEMIRRR